MTIISAKCIAKSKHPECNKTISTVECVYPRWIHAEGRTHRLLSIGEDDKPEYYTPSPMEDPNLSRNASSSRAMPVKRMIQDIIDHPAIPMFWGQNQKGMQAGGEINEYIRNPWKEGLSSIGTMLDRKSAWLQARDNAIKSAEAFDAAGYAKQIVNRLLEPFSHIKVVITATEWTNFFGLRIHEAAEPHIKLLAERIKAAINGTEAVTLRYGQWHLPYVDHEDSAKADTRPGDYWGELLKLSTARCARTSYHTHDGRQPNFEEDLALYDRLVGSHPLHASPTEHQATPDRNVGSPEDGDVWANPQKWGNLVGFIQHRKTLNGEHIR